ncbi:MAG TPA: DUF1552 domain-containing protein [Chthonomonadaceae bacterium]|nr:DUF1552 domain-containing protein [Chthonomonadaceae bacterium]
MGKGALPISRRTVLKGIGVTMCLPLLEAMEPLVAYAGGKSRPPVRMAVLYMPNGVHPHAWAPTGAGSAFELSPILSPLQNVKSDILVLSELMNKQSIDGDGHYAKVAPFLAGTHITKTTGSDLCCGGVSMDQIAAQHVGNMTLLPSLELSIEPPTTYVDINVGYTALYGSHISWNTPRTPVTREINPQLAFDRLFRSRAGRDPGADAADKSVLDAVMEDARSLNAKIGSADRQKLQEYFDSVRSVEQRIRQDTVRRKDEYDGDPIARQEIAKLGGRIKDYYQDPAKIRERGIDHTEQVRLMLDIMVLAFWTDSTRVATFMFGNEVSGRNFSFLPGVNGGHHEISHHENDKTKLEEYHKINTWHIQQYAYMLERMKAIREGDGTLLDNAMVLFGGGMRDGNAHSPYNLPIVLAGRAGGTLATGRALTYASKTPLCNLYRSMLTRVGVPVEHFGDSVSELPGLSDPTFKGV